VRLKETDITATREDIHEMVRLLSRRAPNARTQEQEPNHGVELAFYELATSEKCLERGELLTRIMQMPAGLAPILMELVNHEGPWTKRPPMDIWIAVRNNGTEPLEVIHDRRGRPQYDEETGDPNGDYDFKCQRRVIAPGKTVELSPHWAAHLLRSRCQRASHVARWNKWKGYIGVADDVEEVGYRVRLPWIDADHPDREIVAKKSEGGDDDPLPTKKRRGSAVASAQGSPP